MSTMLPRLLMKKRLLLPGWESTALLLPQDDPAASTPLLLIVTVTCLVCVPSSASLNSLRESCTKYQMVCAAWLAEMTFRAALR